MMVQIIELIIHNKIILHSSSCCLFYSLIIIYFEERKTTILYDRRRTKCQQNKDENYSRNNYKKYDYIPNHSLCKDNVF